MGIEKNSFVENKNNEKSKNQKSGLKNVLDMSDEERKQLLREASQLLNDNDGNKNDVKNHEIVSNLKFINQEYNDICLEFDALILKLTAVNGNIPGEIKNKIFALKQKCGEFVGLVHDQFSSLNTLQPEFISIKYSSRVVLKDYQSKVGQMLIDLQEFDSF